MNIFDRPEFEEFKDRYRSAKGILSLEKNRWYLELLTKSYENREEIDFIKKANDLLDTAPVYTWIKIHYKEIEEHENLLEQGNRLEDFEQSQLRISIGAFWGWIMQYDPNYKFYMTQATKQRIKGKLFNFKTAMRFKAQKKED